MTATTTDPLTREEVARAVERRGPSRIPMVMAKWWGEGLGEQYGERLAEFDRYPNDAPILMANPVDFGAMSMPWLQQATQEKRGHDSGRMLPDWRYLDDFVAEIHRQERPERLDSLQEEARRTREAGRYLLFGWWGLFFERPWGIRSMTNLLTDYYTNPAEVHRLHDTLCEQYVALIRRAARDLKPDGFWTSDDLGHQTQCMMKPAHFREFLLPYYRRVGEACREAGMHFWLHSCGNNTDLLDDLIDAGVSVFHPVQKHTMDERAVASKYGDRMAFLVGFDVQHILQEGTTAEVRAEVRHLVDTFDGPKGGMCLAAGNGIVSGTPFENIDAFLDEAVCYGREHRRRFAGR